MKVNEIKEGMQNIEVIGKITAKQMSPEGSVKKWAKCNLNDETGTILVWLWNEDAAEGRFDINEKVKITNAYSRLDREGNLTISPSKWGGKVELVKE